MIKSKVGRRGLIWLLHCSLSLRKSGQKLREGTWRQRPWKSIVYWPVPHGCFLVEPRTSSPGDGTWLSPTSINHEFRQFPTALPTAWFYRGIFLSEAPSSQMALAVSSWHKSNQHWYHGNRGYVGIRQQLIEWWPLILCVFLPTHCISSCSCSHTKIRHLLSFPLPLPLVPVREFWHTARGRQRNACPDCPASIPTL